MSEFARQFVVSLTHQLLRKNRTSNRPLVKQLLPYCLYRRGGDKFLILNRQYKPLGWPPGLRSFLDYSSREFDSFEITLTEAQLIPLGYAKTEHGEFFYLYGGDTGRAPWADLKAASDYCEQLRGIFGFDIMSADGAK